MSLRCVSSMTLSPHPNSQRSLLTSYVFHHIGLVVFGCLQSANQLSRSMSELVAVLSIFRVMAMYLPTKAVTWASWMGLTDGKNSPCDFLFEFPSYHSNFSSFSFRKTFRTLTLLPKLHDSIVICFLLGVVHHHRSITLLHF